MAARDGTGLWRRACARVSAQPTECRATALSGPLAPPSGCDCEGEPRGTEVIFDTLKGKNELVRFLL